MCAPETYGVLWSVVEESWVVFVRPHRKAIYLPCMESSSQQDPIEAKPHVGAFAYIHKPARTILQFLPAGSHMQRSPGSPYFPRLAANREIRISKLIDEYTDEYLLIRAERRWSSVRISTVTCPGIAEHASGRRLKCLPSCPRCRQQVRSTSPRVSALK